MYHYTDPGGKPSDKTGYCKYCGRPLKNHASILQGFGDVCLEKHKRRRVRRLKKVEELGYGLDTGEFLSDKE